VRYVEKGGKLGENIKKPLEYRWKKWKVLRHDVKDDLRCNRITVRGIKNTIL